MYTLIGILLDVSASMREKVKGRINKKCGKWARSVFKVIDDLIKHDVSSNNRVFAIGVGGCGDQTFDILRTVKQFQNGSQKQIESQSYDEILEKLFIVLEKGGVRTIRKWAEPTVIKNTVTKDMANLILDQLQSDAVFLEMFVYKFLPVSCRNWTSQSTEAKLNGSFIGMAAFGFLKITQYMCTSTVSQFVTAKEENIMEVEEKAKSFLLKPVEDVFSVHEAHEIVHGYIDDKELTDERLDELMKIVEPFIYGRTPLYSSIEEATYIFLQDQHSKHKKLLFVLSDGDPTDEGELEKVLFGFKSLDITIVNCFITRSDNVEPRRLFSEENACWEDGAKFLFRLSSIVPTDRLYRSIFVKRGWTIDINNNETRLFIQVNHPENIHDACDIAKTVVCSQDALCDLLVNVSLERYINRNTEELAAGDQGDDYTCYAFVAATVIHLSINRILGRADGYPDFNIILQSIIRRYGIQKASTIHVLKHVCPKYRLQCRAINIEEALKAIIDKRPVVAIYRLTDDESQLFSNFFYEYPKGILSKKQIDITKRSESITPADLNGHAVVLTGFNSECLRLMSSWGDKWADDGFFRVQNAKVLHMEFIDVFWESIDLTRSERAYYKMYGKHIAQQLTERYVGLQKAVYECPLCKVSSLVIEFGGSLRKTVCPKCNETFLCGEAGNILAMNIYLTSLAATTKKGDHSVEQY